MIADPNKKTLIIVESPTKARTISRFLPQSCTVIASMGHIVDLAPEPSTGVYGVDVADGYSLEYEIDDSKRDILQKMKALLRDAEQLMLATDEDREGESISWHLLNQLKPKCPVYRMVFHEITKSAILGAFSSCRELDMNLVHAQEARRAVDRLQGYGISPIISRKLGGRYSAGRVQSPGLKLIVEREKLRREFASSSYYSVEAAMKAGDASFPAVLVRIGDDDVASSRSYDRETGALREGHVPLSAERAEEIAREIEGREATVFSVTNQEKMQLPARPFTTSTLQQDASRKLRKSVRDIMSIAQQLYENGFITYMRTDSPTLSAECIGAARAQVEAMFGHEYLSSKPRNYKATQESAQEAHEAIRPAGNHFRRPEETGLSGDQLKLYTLIWKRTLATQMKEAEKSSTTAILTIDDYSFSSSGTTIKFPGFLKLYSVSTDDSEDEAEEGILPSLEGGARIPVMEAEARPHTTEPPARYNEASLVQKLESEGIGRPSTYAAIISTLLDRKYVVRQGQQLVPTFTGFFVDSFLESTFPRYIGYGFTSTMEEGLDKIAEGKESKKDFLDGFWKGHDEFPGLEKDIESVKMTVRRSDVKNLQIPGLQYAFDHEGAKVGYSIKTGKFGPYLASDFFDAEAGKDRMASIDQAKYFPGTFTDPDAAAILFPAASERVALCDDIYVMNGRYGEYLLREGDGKTVRLPRMKASSLSPRLAALLFELPKVIGKDDDGNDVVLASGPYGFYAKYCGRNIRVADPLSPDIAAIIADGSGKGASEKRILRDYGEFEGKSLQLVDGRYGAYLRWGDRNCALSGEEKRNPDAITPERAAEIAAAAPERKTVRRRRAASSGGRARRKADA